MPFLKSEGNILYGLSFRLKGRLYRAEARCHSDRSPRAFVLVPALPPVLAFAGKHRGAGKKAHGGEAEESISIASLKANQKVKLIYWKRH